MRKTHWESSTSTKSHGTIARFLLLSILLIPRCLFADEAKVLHEDLVTRFTAANNGAGPTWCYGAPLIVRYGNDVFVSIIETGVGVPPLCNTRWRVWKRFENEWKVIATEREFKQREPCPIAILPREGIFLSANPSLTAPGTRYRACLPSVFRISDALSGIQTQQEAPQWSAVANFTDHSYRGFAADRERGQLLLLNIDSKSSEQYVSLRDSDGRWHPRGKIKFPIRAAYPQVALRNGAAHVLAIGDIREPNEEWQQLKRSVLKREWDYVFRRLFYCTATNVDEGEFGSPIEIDTVEATAGHILNLDIHVDRTGAAHLLYLKKPHQHVFIRDKYFPGQAITSLLEYVVIANNNVVRRETLSATPADNEVGIDPVYARFHVAIGEALSVVVAGQRVGGEFVNVVRSIRPQSEFQEIPLKKPFRMFFTAVPRAGCEPSDIISMFGTSDDVPNLRYAAIELRMERPE